MSFPLDSPVAEAATRDEAERVEHLSACRFTGSIVCQGRLP
jgi:hypothetical protein